MVLNTNKWAEDEMKLYWAAMPFSDSSGRRILPLLSTLLHILAHEICHLLAAIQDGSSDDEWGASGDDRWHGPTWARAMHQVFGFSAIPVGGLCGRSEFLKNPLRQWDRNNPCSACFPSGVAPDYCPDGCRPTEFWSEACRECLPRGRAPNSCSTGCPSHDQLQNACGECTLGGRIESPDGTCPGTGCPPGQDKNNPCRECAPRGFPPPPICRSTGCPPGQVYSAGCAECVPAANQPSAICPTTGCPPGQSPNLCGDCTLGGLTPAVCPRTGCPPGQDRNNACGECWARGREKPVCSATRCPYQVPQLDFGCGICVARGAPPMAVCPATGCPPDFDRNNTCRECWFKGQQKPVCDNGCPAHSRAKLPFLHFPSAVQVVSSVHPVMGVCPGGQPLRQFLVEEQMLPSSQPKRGL
eukprot:tig00000681_g3079.t1